MDFIFRGNELKKCDMLKKKKLVIPFTESFSSTPSGGYTLDMFKLADNGAGSAGVAVRYATKSSYNFTVPMPADWKEGTNFDWYIRWAGGSNGAVEHNVKHYWESLWIPSSGAIGNTSGPTGVLTREPDEQITIKKIFTTYLGQISGAGKTADDTLCLRWERSDLDTDDTYQYPIWILSSYLLYETDKFGLDL